jgi:hypothetical protein
LTFFKIRKLDRAEYKLKADPDKQKAFLHDTRALAGRGKTRRVISVAIK